MQASQEMMRSRSFWFVYFFCMMKKNGLCLVCDVVLASKHKCWSSKKMRQEESSREWYSVLMLVFCDGGGLGLSRDNVSDAFMLVKVFIFFVCGQSLLINLVT